MPTTDYNAWMHHFIWASGQPIGHFEWTAQVFPSNGNGRIKAILMDTRDVWYQEAPWTRLRSIVEVPLPLEIMRQPADVSVGIGRDATLALVADGTSPISYQWQFMGADLPGATTSTFTITAAQPSQSGLYRVVLGNAHGTMTSRSALLSVQGVVGWGLSAFGSLRAPATVTNVVALSSGVFDTLALRADGTVVAWGYNPSGAANVPDGLDHVVAISAGDLFSLVLRSDGTVTAWGSSYGGVLDIPQD